MYYIYTKLFVIENELKSGLNYKGWLHCDYTHRKQRKSKILFDVMHWKEDEVIGGLY